MRSDLQLCFAGRDMPYHLADVCVVVCVSLLVCWLILRVLISLRHVREVGPMTST